MAATLGESDEACDAMSALLRSVYSEFLSRDEDHFLSFSYVENAAENKEEDDDSEEA